MSPSLWFLSEDLSCHLRPLQLGAVVLNFALSPRDLREGLKQVEKAEQQQQQRQDRSVGSRHSQHDNTLSASRGMPTDRLPPMTFSVSPRQSLQKGKIRADSAE